MFRVLISESPKLEYPDLPIIGTTSRFVWTGPNLCYIFLTTQTKSLMKASLVIITTKLTQIHAYLSSEIFCQNQFSKIFCSTIKMLPFITATQMAGMSNSPVMNLWSELVNFIFYLQFLVFIRRWEHLLHENIAI